MRTKGLWTIAVLVVYFGILTAIITLERSIMIESVAELQEAHEREERLIALNAAVSRTVLTVNENYFAANVDDVAKVLVLDVEAVMPGLSRLLPVYPSLSDDIELLAKSIDELNTAPSRATIADLRGGLHQLVVELDAISNDVNSRKQKLLEQYRQAFTRVTLEWAGFGVVGLGLLSGLILIFFRRLTNDIQIVAGRAIGIVRGYRGEPLRNKRDDEVGALIDAVNQMQEELVGREGQLEISRQQHFHKEKMAAIGSLAAAVAHEINNPLSAIVGVAQAIDHECQNENCGNRGVVCHPEMILEQARRVMTITRQISEFSVPQSPDPELLDINGLLRSTCNFVKFDRRFRLLTLELDLSASLPAVYAIADQLVQVAINLLINAADALEGKVAPLPTIRVVTLQREDKVILQVIDNGMGIAPENIELVFKERFSTKGPGRGSGLGLSLCRTLIREAGGEITIASVVGEGTTVTVELPVPLLGSGTGGI